jgi:protein bicaudal C
VHSSTRPAYLLADPHRFQVDVPKDLHFYVIGRKGENIKEVMATSGCHVHFPETPKGPRGVGGQQQSTRDQVSISGTPECVEKARHLLRGLLPITISFDIPETVASDRISMSEEVYALAREYDVTVFFKQRQGLLPLALVKGMRRRSNVVEVAAGRLRYVPSRHLVHRGTAVA